MSNEPQTEVMADGTRRRYRPSKRIKRLDRGPLSLKAFARTISLWPQGLGADWWRNKKAAR